MPTSLANSYEDDMANIANKLTDRVEELETLLRDAQRELVAPGTIQERSDLLGRMCRALRK